MLDLVLSCWWVRSIWERKSKLCEHFIKLSYFELTPLFLRISEILVNSSDNRDSEYSSAIGKLITAVLLLVVLALVVYGLSTNGFAPLIEKTQGMIDSVLILFKIGDGGSGGNDGCYEEKISEKRALESEK